MFKNMKNDIKNKRERNTLILHFFMSVVIYIAMIYCYAKKYDRDLFLLGVFFIIFEVSFWGAYIRAMLRDKNNEI